MRDETDAEADSAARIASLTPWVVAEVHALPEYRFTVRFVDGVEGEASLRAMIFGADAGIFAQLRDPQIFAEAFVEDGVVTWPNGLDLAPDAMYDVIRSGAVFTG